MHQYTVYQYTIYWVLLYMYIFAMYFVQNWIKLSNSNPTWNSTELELVEVGVDFVFQCHNNKKNNNPHLILIYRMRLQVYGLGR